jgi:hypothetical protein
VQGCWQAWLMPGRGWESSVVAVRTLASAMIPPAAQITAADLMLILEGIDLAGARRRAALAYGWRAG